MVASRRDRGIGHARDAGLFSVRVKIDVVSNTAAIVGNRRVGRERRREAGVERFGVLELQMTV